MPARSLNVELGFGITLALEVSRQHVGPRDHDLTRLPCCQYHVVKLTGVEAGNCFSPLVANHAQRNGRNRRPGEQPFPLPHQMEVVGRNVSETYLSHWLGFR